ncbi:MAG: ABC transporter permease [Coriobacteriia bacterium]|nr:ABC transporter permease [Coriobacteriia bacterium]
MTALGSRARVVATILGKDVRAYTRDRLWVLLTTFGLVMFVAVFYLMPTTVDETITVGVYPAALAEALTGMGEDGAEEPEGLDVVAFDTVEDLRDVVSGERPPPGDIAEIAVGLAFPPDFVERTSAGERTTVEVYVEAGVPSEIRGAMTSAIREIAYLLQATAAGQDPEAAIPVRLPEEETIILGEDRAGRQVSLRERMRPMLAYFVLMMESMALASLVAIEVEQRTVTALLVTPARVGDVLAAKTILGTLLAFGQALILLAVTRSLIGQWWLLLTATLLGAVIATAVALISGSAGRDFMGTLFLGVVFLIPLALPAFTILFPGSAPLWIRAVPTYGVFQTMVGVTAYRETWTELWRHLAGAVAWAAALLAVGLVVLRRKVQTL